MDGQEIKMTSPASIPRSQDSIWESCSLGLLPDIITESELCEEHTITRYRLQKGDFLSRYLASFPSNSMYTIEKQQQQHKKSQHLQRTWDLRVGSIKRMFQIQGPMMVHSSADSLNIVLVRGHLTIQVWAQESKMIHFYLFCQIKVSQACYFTYPQLWNQLPSTPQNMAGWLHQLSWEHHSLIKATPLKTQPTSL